MIHLDQVTTSYPSPEDNYIFLYLTYIRVHMYDLTDELLSGESLDWLAPLLVYREGVSLPINSKVLCLNTPSLSSDTTALKAYHRSVIDYLHGSRLRSESRVPSLSSS